MFVPRPYRAKDEKWCRRIIDAHPLATLVTNSESAPYATRLPALITPGTPDDKPLVGAEIIGHMNRANPHWPALAHGIKARLMFEGPDGYVTPAVYHEQPAAPTWNFVSVHLIGRLRLVRESEETFQVVCWTAETLEQRFGDKWDHSPSLDYFRRILPGVGAFRLQIEVAEAMFKLSQDKPAHMQEAVIRRFEQDASGTYWPLARIMRELGIGEPHAVCACATDRGDPA